MSVDPNQFLITGGGLIGGTLAADYARLFPSSNIYVYEINEHAKEQLVKALNDIGVKIVHIISEDSALYDIASEADVVDHCVPIDQLGPLQQKISAHLSSGTVVTNRGSAQAYSKAAISPHIDNERNIHHFGIHPIVGRERKPGEDLKIYTNTFKDQTAIMEPLPANASDDAIRAHGKLKSLNEALGFKVKELPAHIHDQLLGALSHENTGALQTQVNVSEDISGIGATIMRAASGTPGMWLPIMEFNSAAITASANTQKHSFLELYNALKDNDHDALLCLVEKAHAFRMKWGDEESRIDGLESAVAEIKTEYGAGPKSIEQIAAQLALPFAFSIARTNGFEEIVSSLDHKLADYGHKYTDLLNSSAKDSTLAGKYPPQNVVSLLLQTKEQTLALMEEYQSAYNSYITNVNAYADGHEKAKNPLTQHVNDAAAKMADDSTPRPRKDGGGDGFDPLKDPKTPQKHYNLPSEELTHCQDIDELKPN